MMEVLFSGVGKELQKRVYWYADMVRSRKPAVEGLAIVVLGNGSVLCTLLAQSRPERS